MRYEIEPHYAVSEKDIKMIGKLTSDYLILSRKYDAELGEDKALLMDDMKKLYEKRQIIIRKTKNNIYY